MDVLLQDIDILKNVDNKTLELLDSSKIIKSTEKDNILFFHDDEITYFYYILSGWVKLFRETFDGDEVIIDILNEGHQFGEDAIFNNNIHTYGAEIIEPAKLLLFPAKVFAQAIESDKELSFNMLNYLNRKQKLSSKEIEHFSVQNAAQRIGCFLLKLCKQEDGEAITLHLPYDKLLIATRLGMKAETFSRSLKTLKNNVGLKIKHGNLV